MAAAPFTPPLIEPFDDSLTRTVQHKLDMKTKPQGSLGDIEATGLRLALIQGRENPRIEAPTVLIFAGDHGVCEEGVSAFPQAVTEQMVHNFLSGGAAISVLAKQHALDFYVVDAGVKAELPDHPQLLKRKVVAASANFTCGLALTEAQVNRALVDGQGLIRQLAKQGSNTVIFGEMGIGNTTPAAAITHCITQVPVADCVGAGTGLDAEGVNHKVRVIQGAVDRHLGLINSPIDLLSRLGGPEIAMMVGAYLAAASQRITVIVDGFIASAALAVAAQFDPLVLEYAIFSHGSAEQGHGVLLKYFGRKPLLNLNLRLGEGSGAALAYPLVESAARLLREMASFEQAGVSKKTAGT